MRLDLAAEGYLVTPGGCWRYVHGLTYIARDTVAAGVTVVWGDPPGGELACCHIWSRLVVLSSKLIEREPWEIRAVWSHELGHAVMGQSHERAIWWQVRQYRDLIVVPA